MPWGLKRFQQAESLYFITFSCYHRYPHLSASEPKTVVEAITLQAIAVPWRSSRSGRHVIANPSPPFFL